MVSTSFSSNGLWHIKGRRDKTESEKECVSSYIFLGKTSFHFRGGKFQNLLCFWTELSTNVGEKKWTLFFFICLMWVRATVSWNWLHFDCFPEGKRWMLIMFSTYIFIRVLEALGRRGCFSKISFMLFAHFWASNVDSMSLLFSSADKNMIETNLY